jgi:cell division protein FtsZ
MPQVNPEVETFARIKVVGVGGAGGAAVNRMVEAGVQGVEFITINTDAQAIHYSKAQTKLHIGGDTTKGLGAGADPKVGEKAAEVSSEDIKKVLEGADMVFVTIGAGGGTGSGAGHIVARIAREQGCLVVGFATKPFAFEGEKRRRNSEYAIEKLRENVDTLITVPNDRLLQTIDRKTPLLDAFKVADDVLRQGVQGISDLITVHGLINLDFADVKAVMSNAGSALMGIGRASGDDRATEAAHQAIESPLLEVSIDGARGILFNVIGGFDMSMHEINAAAETITAAVDPEANIIFGATINPELEGEIIITVVATGFEASYFSNRRQHIRETEGHAPNLSLQDTSVDTSSHDVVDLDSSDGNTLQNSTFNSYQEPVKLADDGPINTTEEPIKPAEIKELKEVANTKTMTDDDIKDINLDEDSDDKDKMTNDFADDKPVPNIWTFDAPEKDEEKFDKPSFLRRFSIRKKDNKTTDDDDKNEPDSPGNKDQSVK